MPIDACPIEKGSEGGATKIRPLTLADIDRRTRAYQSAERLLGGLISDMGGESNTSIAQRELAQRAAVLGAMIEDCEARWLRGEAINLVEYLSAINAHRRVLCSIGLERRARDATQNLDSYLARDQAA